MRLLHISRTEKQCRPRKPSALRPRPLRPLPQRRPAPRVASPAAAAGAAPSWRQPPAVRRARRNRGPLGCRCRPEANRPPTRSMRSGSELAVCFTSTAQLHADRFRNYPRLHLRQELAVGPLCDTSIHRWSWCFMTEHELDPAVPHDAGQLSARRSAGGLTW